MELSHWLENVAGGSAASGSHSRAPLDGGTHASIIQLLLLPYLALGISQVRDKVLQSSGLRRHL